CVNTTNGLFPGRDFCACPTSTSTAISSSSNTASKLPQGRHWRRTCLVEIFRRCCLHGNSPVRLVPLWQRNRPADWTLAPVNTCMNNCLTSERKAQQFC